MASNGDPPEALGPDLESSSQDVPNRSEHSQKEKLQAFEATQRTVASNSDGINYLKIPKSNMVHSATTEGATMDSPGPFIARQLTIPRKPARIV